MSGSKDGHTIFHGILPATTRGLASKTAINWHLKVKDIEYNVGITKNYCITVSMQKISSIHKLIWQILGSHELNDLTHFLIGPPKNHWNNFRSTMQKISSFHQFILEIQLILESCDLTGQTHFWPHSSKKFLIHLYVNLYQHTKNQAISLICSGDMID